MTANEMPSVFRLNFIASLDDDTLYLAGTVNELEDRDVPHTIMWERIGGEWNRYQWKNRTHDMTVYVSQDDIWDVYLGYEGTVKVHGKKNGSRNETLEIGPDAPSSLRTVSCIRTVGDQLIVCGMRRMVYARPIAGGPWQRLDDGLRLNQRDLTLGGLYSIDGDRQGNLYAVGMRGEVWQRHNETWEQIQIPTNLTFMTVRCLHNGVVLAGGELGALWWLKDGFWREISHPFSREIFSCIEYWGDQCFVVSDNGICYTLTWKPDPVLTQWTPKYLDFVSRVWRTSQKVWFVGGTKVASLSTDGWRDESPPAEFMK